MFPANLHVIRAATDADEFVLRRLAELNSRAPLTGRVFVGEMDGTVAAALSPADGRVIADPVQDTALLVVILRMRAHALLAYEAVPSLSERIAAALAPARPRAERESLPAVA
jgi:hypothetical protein